MAIENMPAEIPAALVTLWSQVVHGPSAAAAYLLNRGDRGLLGSLRTLSAETASARPEGRSSVAAHVDHVRYGLELLNRWAEGEKDLWANANFAASWARQHVDEEQWQALQKALALGARLSFSKYRYI